MVRVKLELVKHQLVVRETVVIGNCDHGNSYYKLCRAKGLCPARRKKHIIQKTHNVGEQKLHIIANGKCKPMVFLKPCFGMIWMLSIY